MASHFVLDEAMKAMQWERIKGELRALVALQGSYSISDDEPRPAKWERLQEAVETFILSIEDDGLHD